MPQETPLELTAEQQKFMAALFTANAIQIMLEPFYPCLQLRFNPVAQAPRVPANQTAFAPFKPAMPQNYTHCPLRHKKPRDGAGRIPASRFN